MRICDYKPGDELAILDLFEKSFKKKMSMTYWNWRFAKNPFSKEFMIKLMWDDDVLVGHYAVSPVELLSKDHILKTALSMTTMTHPEYGGKGIFRSLAESLYIDLIQKHDYQMVWGFPNNNSHYGFNKNLNWDDIAIQGMMSLNSENLLSFLIPVDDFEFNANFDTQIIRNNLNSSEKLVKLNKTRDYLQWRYFDNPMADYKLLVTDNNKGIIIYKVISSFSDSSNYEIDIMDIFFDSDVKILIKLLSAVYTSEKSVKQFNIWDSLYSTNQLMLEKVGFRICPPITYMGGRVFDTKNKSLIDYKNWDISLSYSDIF